jgi:uncharacterized protein (DUF433 family)
MLQWFGVTCRTTIDMAYSVKELLGVGVYTVAEAAMYAHVPTGVMRRWIWGTKSGASVVRPELRLDADETLVTFLDFVQSMAIRSIRKATKDRPAVPLEKIRETIEQAHERYGITYPFARKHSTYLLGREIVLRVDGLGEVQTSGANKHQLVEPKIAELYLHDLSFDSSGLAQSYVAARDGDMQIVMNPRSRFGEPYLSTCGITASSIWNAVQAEGGIEGAARAYEITVEEVHFAAKYYDSLRSADLN